MPIEIRELHIKVTVPEKGSDAAATGDDLIRFGDPVPDAPNRKDGSWDDAGWIDPTEPAAFEAPGGLRGGDDADAATAQRGHSGGINVAWGDGSVRVAGDGFDLFA